MAHGQSAKAEAEIKRNPHENFEKMEASRPSWDHHSTFRYTQTAKPDWTFGSGGNGTDASRAAHVVIDPYAVGRPAVFNYKLLISAVVPRPIAFLSTCSADGRRTNLAPYSYFTVVGHDPPLFVVGFVSARARDLCKDSLWNLQETGECVVNIIGEGFVEAANSTSIDAPYATSEWDVSGLTPAYDCETVKCARVRESVFSIEGKLESLREFPSKTDPEKVSTTMAVIEGTRFWAREDAINQERNIIDPAVLRPIGRLGGITYGRVTEAFELPRPSFEKDLGGRDGAEKLPKKSGK